MDGDATLSVQRWHYQWNYCLMGFAESIANLIKVDDHYDLWIQRGLATGVVFILASFNVAGVKWVIKLQFLLLIALLLAAADFMIGSVVNNPNPGKLMYSSIAKDFP